LPFPACFATLKNHRGGVAEQLNNRFVRKYKFRQSLGGGSEMKEKKGMTYKEAGVDINAGNKAVKLIKKRIEKTFRHFPGKVLTKLGGFSGVAELRNGTKIAAGTDGVGTKLKIAIMLDEHDTVGIDLVAMCVNDILAGGVFPAFFLDYIAMGKQEPLRTAKIVGGIIDGCEMAECALIGGEMAEMPGMYESDEYDLAGFAAGFLDQGQELILGRDIHPGAYVHGLLSSGLHSNGYSLGRKAFEINDNQWKRTLKILNTYYPALGCTLGEELLRPTRIYVKQVKKLLNSYKILGMAHITGGGLIENPPRILPSDCSIEFYTKTWSVPAIMRMIQERGNISDREMRRAFNCGIGYILISSNKSMDGATLIGRVVERKKGCRRVRFIGK